MNYILVMPSPIDDLTLVSDGEAITGLWMGTPPAIEAGSKELSVLREAKKQLDAYFRGDLRQFSLPLRPAGTEFQLQVWKELQQIPYGETISYGELAKRIGNPKGSRAVGLANGKNKISIIIPCHRVIGASGHLTGFGGGLARKAKLLEIERPSLFD
ncbi:MAG: methylated-DNA--[protein]-cysteine S-methyltransferase [Fimbriimonadaceae bacterium]|nr:methylated-DNA--[protein]-cysteine S-methyltransferase [Fimbriimonadaceae bacterium]